MDLYDCKEIRTEPENVYFVQDFCVYVYGMYLPRNLAASRLDSECP